MNEAKSHGKTIALPEIELKYPITWHRVFFTTEVIPSPTFTGFSVLLNPLYYLDSVFIIWIIPGLLLNIVAMPSTNEQASPAAEVPLM